MRPLLTLLLIAQAFIATNAAAASRPLLVVVVAEPYLEMHSGPGRGFPVVYVVGRGDEVILIVLRLHAVGAQHVAAAFDEVLFLERQVGVAVGLVHASLLWGSGSVDGANPKGVES